MQFIDDAAISADKAVSLLKEKKYTVTTAESCTGGLLAAKIIDIPGSSEVFSEGHITYSNEAKVKYLNVSTETLNKHGAVSRETAEEMAIGAVRLSGSHAALSVTGLAGPYDGEDGTKAGTVYIGCCINNRTVVEHHIFEGSRNEVRNKAVVKALQLLCTCLAEEYTDCSF